MLVLVFGDDLGIDMDIVGEIGVESSVAYRVVTDPLREPDGASKDEINHFVLADVTGCCVTFDMGIVGASGDAWGSAEASGDAALLSSS